MDLATRFTRLRALYLPAILELLAEIPAASVPAGSTLVPMAAYHLGTGGKRLRALLPLLVGEALGTEPGRLVPLGAACELLHNATLVHDDLQDGDRTRRGQATVWARFGAPQAINLGDAMFYWTLLALARLDAPPALREALAARVLRETLRVIDGQEREFALKRRPEVSLSDYFAMVEGKTSGLFALPMAGAAVACGAPEGLVEGLAEAARHLGVLFQIQDDVLDLYGDKGRDAPGADIAEGKRSVLVMWALATLPPERAAWLEGVLDAPREETSAADIAQAVGLLRACGALGFALAEIERRRAAAVAVPAVAASPALRELVSGIAELFLAPIAGIC
ncbi:MAG: polyprenyl synthetase family protein [Pseudomonadota bacterium]